MRDEHVQALDPVGHASRGDAVDLRHLPEHVLQLAAAAKVVVVRGTVAGGELRVLLETGRRFSMHHMTVNEITDMGGFVLAHGVVYAEENGRPVIDRVTIWRCRVEGDAIASVDAEAEPSAGRWEAKHRTALEG